MAAIPKKQEQENAIPVTAPPPAAKDELGGALAVGVIVLFCTVILLYLVNYLVYTCYKPDLQAIKEAAAPLSIYRITFFHPEPVERVQFQLSLLCMPVFVVALFWLVNKKRDFFIDNPVISRAVNYSALGIFLIYLPCMLNAALNETKIPGKLNTYFFGEMLIGKYPLPALLLYAGLAYLFLLYKNKTLPGTYKNIISVVCYCVVGYVLYDILQYNVFHIADQNFGTQMETNAVFYPVTQVYAGKSLLVDFNAQYGLYAWMLNPFFKLFGLSIVNFTKLMGALNVLGFLLLYLGIRKIIKQDLFALLVFLCAVFWQYWHSRIGFEECTNPGYYFQYWPIRLVFPCLVFFLFTCYIYGKQNYQRYFLPLLTLGASLGVLWNLDTGLVAYGATGVGLIIAAIHYSTDFKDAVRKSFVNAVWMAGSLMAILALFFLSTKVHSGNWPEIAKFTAFQKQFYISGFFMLPMTALHFWNLPALVYIAGAIYCVFKLNKTNDPDVPVIAFLIILGMGLFTYFQGRSYDLTIMLVMYPAIIIAGILCNKVSVASLGYKIKFHEAVLFFFIPFLFLADGALSMIYYTPDIHTLAANNTSIKDEEKSKEFNERMDFLKKNLPEKDTVVIIAKDFESYFYASGKYYNPLNIPGSTELFLKSDFYKLLDIIRMSRYPVLFDPIHYWEANDTIVELLSQYTEIKDMMPDRKLLFLKPVKFREGKLGKDKNTIYYDYHGEWRYLVSLFEIELPDTFTLELLMRVDAAKLIKNEVVFSSAAKVTPFCGLFLKQNGDQPNQFMFAYGDGTKWCDGALLKLNYNIENHLVLKVEKNIITTFVNGVECSKVNTGSKMKNSEGAFAVNPRFTGNVDEIKISNQ